MDTLPDSRSSRLAEPRSTAIDDLIERRQLRRLRDLPFMCHVIDGAHVTVRPIRPSDAELEEKFVEGLSSDGRYEGDPQVRIRSRRRAMKRPRRPRALIAMMLRTESC